MHDFYLLLTPVLTFFVVALVGFVGCDALFGLDHVDDPVPGPKNLTATPGDGRVDLTWEPASSPPDSYVVKVGTSPGSHPDAHDAGSNTSYTQTNLTNGTTYYFVVTAKKGSNESSNSNEASAVPGLYGVMTALIASKTIGTLRSFTAWLGMGFVVAGKNLQVVKVGRAFAAGNTGVHKIHLIDAATLQELAAVDVNVAGGVPGEFVYADVMPSVILNAGSRYYLLSEEDAAGDQFYDADTRVTTTAAASREFAVYGGNNVYNEAPVDGFAYGPVDLIYIEQ